MAASLVGLSIPTLERNLLNVSCRLSLSPYQRRNICIKCHRQQSLAIVKSTKSNPFRQHVIKRQEYHLASTARRYHCSIIPTTTTTTTANHNSNMKPGSLPSYLSTNRHPISCFPSRFYHNFRYSFQLKESFSTLSVFHNSISTPPNHARHIRQFHTKLSPFLSASYSSSSSSSSSSTTSSSSQIADIPNVTIATTPDPFKIMEKEMSEVMEDLRKELKCEEPLLQHMSQYYFNGKGKTFRPLVSLLMARACNIHCSGEHEITWQQKIVAMVAEMIHTASLVHDDVIDASDTRRSQTSLNALYGQRQAILTGDYIISQASMAVARTRNTQVIKILASILVDLVDGEFMQLGSKENENERFAHYFDKTYKKTASLIANCCKSVAILGNCDEEMAQLCFQYGRNLGLAFQLIDDLLDFTASHAAMGKPTEADLKQGLATAPVLFASQEFPELHAMIMRRFSQEGDVEFARNAVEKSDGIAQTQLLATQHSKEAIRNAQALTDSEARQGLIRLAQILLERKH